MKRKYIIALLLMAALCITAIAIYAQASHVTFRYYGEELSSDEFQAYLDSHHELHCAQVLTEYAILYLSANLFECFDTIEEADAFAIANEDQNRQLKQSILDRIENGEIEVPDIYARFSQMASEREAARGVGYWSLFANAGYNYLLADVAYPTLYYTPPNFGIWSIWKQGNPSGLRLWNNLCGSTFSLVYADSDAFLRGCTAGAGGAYAAQVIAP
jgi:hypothetical protein